MAAAEGARIIDELPEVVDKPAGDSEATSTTGASAEPVKYQRYIRAGPIRRQYARSARPVYIVVEIGFLVLGSATRK